MNILVIGGTRYFGIPMVWSLIRKGHEVTIATRGMTKDPFGDKVSRIRLNLYDPQSARSALKGKKYDVVIDKMGYGSTDIRNILDNLQCRLFIHMSTAGVYQLDHMNIDETEYLPEKEKLIWCTRGDIRYDIEKRMAEAAIAQVYQNIDYTIVRCPYVLGEMDYTKRLMFYVYHVMHEIPMYIDNVYALMSVANAIETADFISFLAEQNGLGSVNCCAKGLFCIDEMLSVVEFVTGGKRILSENGERAPYNGSKSYSLSLNKSEKTGFHFGHIESWLEKLIEYNVRLLNGE